MVKKVKRYIDLIIKILSTYVMHWISLRYNNSKRNNIDKL